MKTSSKIFSAALAAFALGNVASAAVTVGNIGGSWTILSSTPSPNNFTSPGANDGDIELRIGPGATPVPFTGGVVLANPSGTTGGPADNLALPYNSGGAAWINVIDNSNSNAAGSNPSTSEQFANTSVGYFPYADGWIGGSFSGTGTLLSGNLPAGVTVTNPSTGIFNISGLSLDGNLIAIANGNGGTAGDNVASVSRTATGWQVHNLDNDGDLDQAEPFSFLYVSGAAQGVASGRVDISALMVEALNAGTTGSVIIDSDGFYELTINGGALNPSNSILFIVGDTTDNGNGGDNLWSWGPGSGNSFEILSQDLPGINGNNQTSADFRFLVVPLNTANVAATPEPASVIAWCFAAAVAMAFGWRRWRRR